MSTVGALIRPLYSFIYEFPIDDIRVVVQALGTYPLTISIKQGHTTIADLSNWFGAERPVHTDTEQYSLSYGSLSISLVYDRSETISRISRLLLSSVQNRFQRLHRISCLEMCRDIFDYRLWDEIVVKIFTHPLLSFLSLPWIVQICMFAYVENTTTV